MGYSALHSSLYQTSTVFITLKDDRLPERSLMALNNKMTTNLEVGVICRQVLKAHVVINTVVLISSQS